MMDLGHGRGVACAWRHYAHGGHGAMGLPNRPLAVPPADATYTEVTMNNTQTPLLVCTFLLGIVTLFSIMGNHRDQMLYMQTHCHLQGKRL